MKRTNAHIHINITHSGFFGIHEKKNQKYANLERQQNTHHKNIILTFFRWFTRVGGTTFRSSQNSSIRWVSVLWFPLELLIASFIFFLNNSICFFFAFYFERILKKGLIQLYFHFLTRAHIIMPNNINGIDLLIQIYMINVMHYKLTAFFVLFNAVVIL